MRKDFERWHKMKSCIDRAGIISQIRYFDTKCLLGKIALLDKEQFQAIRQKTAELIQQSFVHLPSELPEGEGRSQDAGNPAISLL